MYETRIQQQSQGDAKSGYYYFCKTCGRHLLKSCRSYTEVVSTYFLLTVARFFAGDFVSRRGSDLAVGADENGGSGAKNPQMLIKESINPLILTFVNKWKQLHYDI